MNYANSRMHRPDTYTSARLPPTASYHAKIRNRKAEPEATYKPYELHNFKCSKCNAQMNCGADKSNPTASLPTDTSDAVTGPSSPAHLGQPVGSERAPTNTSEIHSAQLQNCQDLHVQSRQYAEPQGHTCIPLQRGKCNTQMNCGTDKSKPHLC